MTRVELIATADRQLRALRGKRRVAALRVLIELDGSRFDIYDTLTDALGLGVSSDERSKPPCCGEDSLPPVDEETVSTVSEAVRGAARQRR